MSDNPERSTWPEARIIAEPRRSKDAAEPKVLVKRRITEIVGPHNEEIYYLPGQPVISLFTGAGGFDIGLESAGFCTVVQHEMAKDACLTLMGNRPRYFRHSALIQGDIYQTPTSLLLTEAGLRVGEAYVLCGGPPCQGFTTANRRAVKNKKDSRNDLVYEYLRVVNEARPRYFIFENVPGFVSFNKAEYMKGFLRKAYDCYYELVYGLADASEHGVPQCRCRFICMGTRRDIAEIEGSIATLPAPTNFHKRDLAILKKADGSPYYSEEAEMIMQPPGVRYFPDREILIPPAPVAHRGDSGRTKTFKKFYKNLRENEPDRLVESARQEAG